MIYFFLGDDSLSKDKKISEIKKKIFKDQDSLRFDYEVIDAFKLSPSTLKKTLVSLPAVAQSRLIIIRQCHRLSPHNKELLSAFAKEPYSPTDLILESENLDENNSFVRNLIGNISILNFKSKERINVFDLTQEIAVRRQIEALKILSQLQRQGNHPLQIMGGLVWYWKKSCNRMSPALFKKGLLALQEADYNIKRSRLRSDYALELLVVKLCSSEA